MRNALVLFILIGGYIINCASADVMILDPAKSYPPTENVQLMLVNPDRPYVMIGIIEAKGSQYNNQSQVVRAAQKRAAKIGAHAIIPVTNERKEVNPQIIPNGGAPIYIMGGTQLTMKFAAIRFTD
jgi:hypothetical protein